MKCVAIILIVLAYWPLMLDCSVSGRDAFALTHVFPMKTYSTSDAFTMGTAVLQVLPTPRMAYHNNGGQSASRADSTVSIWTVFQITPDGGLSGIGYASFDLTHRQLQTAWSCVRHWWRIGPVWLFEATVSFTIYLLFSLSVAIALLPKHVVEQHVAVAPPQRKPTFVESITSTGGSSKGDTYELVIRNQPSTNVFTLEGRLVLFSEPATSNGPIDWAVLFHPCQYYHPAGHPTESSHRAAQLGVFDERLLYMLFRGVSAYHPWSWYRPTIFVDLPGKVVKQFHAGRGPVVVARIAGVRVVPKRTAHEQTIQRRVVVAHAAKRPTFASCMDRHGGPPKPAVQEHLHPKRPHNPPGWIEDFTFEGRVLLYSGAPTPSGPAPWAYQFDARSGYHLTQSGDESSNRLRDMADGHLLNVLMCEGLVYHPFIVYVPGIIFDVPREIVKDSNTSAVISNYPDLTSTTAATAGLPPSRPGTPEFTTIFAYAAPSIHTTVAPAQLDTVAEREAPGPVVVDQPEDRSFAVAEAVHANSEEDVQSSEEPLHSLYSHAQSSGEAESFTEATSSFGCPSRTTQDIAGLYPTSDSLFHEQRVAVIHELRSLFPLLEEPASQRHALRTWENTWTRATEQTRVKDTRTEDDDQHDEVHTRRKRRGGKKNTCWKNKRRQDKDDYERHPGAGPSGVR